MPLARCIHHNGLAQISAFSLHIMQAVHKLMYIPTKFKYCNYKCIFRFKSCTSSLDQIGHRYTSELIPLSIICFQHPCSSCIDLHSHDFLLYGHSPCFNALALHSHDSGIRIWSQMLRSKHQIHK